MNKRGYFETATS